MTDILLPPWLNIARTTFTPIENTGISRSPFGGPTRTASLGGDRMGMSLEFTATGGASDQLAQRALKSFLVRAGRRNRVFATDPAHTVNGSFPAVELLSNNTFAAGTTGWSNAGSNGVLSVTDRVMRVTRASSALNPQIRQSASVTQYAPYACRAMVLSGAGSQILFAFISGASSFAQTAGPGLATAVLVSDATTTDAVAYDAIGSGGVAGDYFEVPYISVARCALVDAGVNMFTQSDAFDNAAWTKTAASITANSITAPDGTSTADDLVDTGVSTTHSVHQSVTVPTAADDMVVMVAVKARNRNWCSLEFSDGTTTARSTFDLSTGTSGVNGGAGATWSNRRQFISALGNGWYRVTMVARKSAGVTSVTCRIYSANGDGLETYAGASNAAIAIWRATKSIAGVPGRLKLTTTTASNGETQSGSALFLKGLPPSTNNLLLPGALVEIIAGGGSELKLLTAALHSDASGLGYLQLEPAIRISPVDNAPVIIHQPFGRFIFSGQMPSWSNDPGVITTASAEFEEA